MAEYYFSAQIDNETTLCIAPLTDRRLELSGEEIEDASGYFLFATRGGCDPTDVEILARVPSEEAAWRLRGMLGLE